MKIEQDKDLGEILGSEFEFTNVDDWMANLKGFARNLELTTQDMKDNNFDKTVCEEVLDEFEIEDWREKYSSEGNYYTGGEQMEKIYRMLKELNQKGYDTNEEWEIFRSSLATIWQRLPEFYKGKALNQANVDFRPNDYKVDNPFPQFEILPSL